MFEDYQTALVQERAQQETQDAAAITKEIKFDRKLKERLQIYQDDKSLRNYKFHKTYMSKIFYLMIFVYFIVVPFLQTPTWCI